MSNIFLTGIGCSNLDSYILTRPEYTRFRARPRNSFVYQREMMMALFRKRGFEVGFTSMIAAAALFAQQCVHAAEERQSRKTRVAIFSGDGVSKHDPAQIKACLPESKGFEVKLITAKEVREGGLERFDVVIHPGGSGSGQAKALGDEGRKRVRRFVKDGGGFVGVCAGAYLASAEYPWALKLLDARVVDDEHWARGVGDVRLRVPKTGQAALGSDDATTNIHYENGPLLGPADHSDIPDFESLATFETEIRENDAPKGVMKGTTAIARGSFGEGRVVCFSPHPEKTRGREAFVTEAVRWAADSNPARTLDQPQRGDSQ